MKKFTKIDADKLRSAGFSASQIMIAASLAENGIIMTKCIADFTSLYDSKEIDGFPNSSIEVLETHYGKKLRNMRKQTICEKVAILQRSITTDVDYDSISDAVNYYLS